MTWDGGPYCYNYRCVMFDQIIDSTNEIIPTFCYKTENKYIKNKNKNNKNSDDNNKKGKKRKQKKRKFKLEERIFNIVSKYLKKK